MICGVGRVGGLCAGFVSNRQGLVGDPERPGARRPAAILYRAGIAKISAFSPRVQRRRHPAGVAAGHRRLRHRHRGRAPGPARLRLEPHLHQLDQPVPMFTVLLRKASGAGYYAMAGLPYDPVVQLSTPICAAVSVMEGRTLAIATYNTKLDDDFQIVDRRTPTSARTIEGGMREVEAAHRARHGSVRGGAPARHRRDRRARRAAAPGSRCWSRRATRRSATGGSRTRASGRCTTSRSSRRGCADGRRTRTDGWSGPRGAGARARRRSPRSCARRRVGLWRGAPAPGTARPAGSPIGELEMLGVLHELVAPEHTFGVVVAERGGPRSSASVRSATATRGASASARSRRALGDVASRGRASLAGARPPGLFARAAAGASTRGRRPRQAELRRGRRRDRHGPHRRAARGDEDVQPARVRRRGCPRGRACVRIVPADEADVDAGDPILEVETAD